MAEQPFDPYYSRGEVSNSDLTALKLALNPQLNFVKEEDKRKAFHLGTLVDALVTEPEKCNHYAMTVDDEKYTEKDWKWGLDRLAVLKKQATKDRFLDFVLKNAVGQKTFINPHMKMEYQGFKFELPVRCKFDWWLGEFGGDLKTTAATSQEQFETQIDFVDWDRSRAWYMDLTHSIDPRYGNQDFIFAVSKTKKKVFYKKIERGDELYLRGREKALKWAFRMWCLL